MEQEKRAVNPKVINMPFEDNDSGNSKPADLCNLDIDLPYSIVDNENANIMMLSINTPNVVAMNPLNSLDYWNSHINFSNTCRMKPNYQFIFGAFVRPQNEFLSYARKILFIFYNTCPATAAK